MSAPFGYVVNDKYVNISVDTDTAFETDGDTNDAIITVEYSDAPAVGELTVEKRGEVLDGFKGGLLASSYEKEFVYREGSLAGAKFKVYAAEDIYTADNQKDADGNRIKYYSKGDLVTTLTTGMDGKATAKNLPLGQYRVVEVEAPYGYVLNPNEQKVTFTYVDDKTPVIKESLTFSDDRQKLDMSVTKLDAEDNTPIAGAVFGLYADEDIKNVAGKVIIEKGTLLEKATSDENGKIAFVKDYPFAKYVARELVKPAGYVTNEEAVNFDTKYQGQDVKAAVYNSEYKNTPTTFEFTKTDIQFTVEDTGKVQHVEMKDEVPTGSIVINKDGEFVTDTTLMKGYWYDFIFNFFKDSLAGVTFDVYAKEDIVSADGLDTVYHKAGDKVATIVTNDKGIARIDDLPLGKYYLVETKTIDGFVLDDTQIERTVTGKDGKVLDTLTTDKNGHAESKELPICTYNEDGSFKEDIHYTVVETKAADGYILDETAHDVTLRYDDNAPDVVVTTLKLINVPTEPKLPQTGDNANPLLYLGIGALALITGVGVGLRGRKKKNKQ